MSWNDTLEFMDSVTSKPPPRSVRIPSPKRALTKKQIGLVRWRLNFSGSTRGTIFPRVALQVEGIRTDDGENWTSSEVLAVELPRTIHTANTIYNLVGKVDLRISLEKGMPYEFINKFSNGFPPDWMEAINEFLDFLFQHGQKQRVSITEVTAEESPPTEMTDLSPTRMRDLSPDHQSTTHNGSLSPARMGTLSPCSSPTNLGSVVPTPSPTRSPSPAKTPPILRENPHLNNVTLRKTAPKKKKAAKKSIPYNAAPTPVLNRSKRGRLVKPRLAPGERIIYDCYGNPIEVRKDATRTHISNGSSSILEAMCKSLELEMPKSPSQTERRLSLVNTRSPAQKSKRISMAAQKAKVAKMLAYDNSKESPSLDGVSSSDDNKDNDDSNDESGHDGMDHDAFLTPMPNRRMKLDRPRRVILSEDEASDPEQEDVPKKSSRTKPKPPQKKPAPAQKKRKSPQKTIKSPIKKHKVQQKKQKPQQSKESTPDETLEESTETAVPPEEEVSRPKAASPAMPKPRKKVWNVRNKDNLKKAFYAINPCTDKDWQRLVDVLDVPWTVEEVKAQVEKMKLEKLQVTTKEMTPKTALVEKLRQLVPDGKIPQKGTIRREVLEEEVMQHLFVRAPKQDENLMDDSLNDSQDMLLREAMQNHALDKDIRVQNTITTRYVTPSRRGFIPKPVTACRRRSSLAAIEAVGDDFSVPDRTKMMKYALKHRAQQFNHRLGAMKTINEKEDDDDQ